MLIFTHCYRLACFYLIYDPRVNPARIQSRATIGSPAKRHSDGRPVVPRASWEVWQRLPPFYCRRYTLNRSYVPAF